MRERERPRVILNASEKVKLLVIQMQGIMGGTSLKDNFRNSVLGMLSLRCLWLLLVGYTYQEYMCEVCVSDLNLELSAFYGI